MLCFVVNRDAVNRNPSSPLYGTTVFACPAGGVHAVGSL